MNISQKLQDTEHTEQIITHQMIKNVFPNNNGSIHSLINRATKRDELISLRRGLYLINDPLAHSVPSKLFLANQIIQPSYVSLESALEFHGWIPERVETIYSVSAFRRQKTFKNQLGRFVYFTSTTDPFLFFSGVEKTEYAGKTVSIASPLRALIDLCYFRKIDSMNKQYLEESLRIEPENISNLTLNDINQVRGVYQTARVQKFFDSLLGT